MQILLLTLALLTPAAGADSLIQFRLDGVPLSASPLVDLTKSIPPQEITVYEPHEKQEVKYRGFPANAVLTKAFGAEWQKRDEIVFVCADGYRAVLPAAKFSEYEAYLTFERVGANEFALTNTLQGNERVPLGPLYLVWDNVKAPALKAEAAHGWPYQVVGIEAQRSSATKIKSVPAKNASAIVKAGYDAFQKNCVTCHRVNGEGGEKSFDLTQPVAVTTYFKEPWLEKWIINPSALRPGTTMPALSCEPTEAKRIAKSIIAYLKAMAPKAR